MRDWCTLLWQFDVCAQFRQGRRANAWSQQDLADKIGVSRKCVVSIEKGAPTAQLHLVLEALRWVGHVCDMVPEADDGLLDQYTGGAVALDTLLVTPTEWADQIMRTTKPSRTLRGADTAASGRAALEAAGVDLLALERRTAKGRRPVPDGDVTRVEEDEAPPEMAYLLRSPANAKRLHVADQALRSERGHRRESDRD